MSHKTKNRLSLRSNTTGKNDNTKKNGKTGKNNRTKKSKDMAPIQIREKYVSFTSDFGFKKLFGTEVNKDLLLSFLNEVLRGQETIVDITYLDKEQLGPVKASRRSVFDIYCKNDQGDYIIVEMQNEEEDYFEERTIYYSTFAVNQQGVKGKDWNFRFKRVYIVGILNFILDKKNPDYYHHEVGLLDKKTYDVYSDKLQIVYIELPKFKKEETELETLLDKWLFTIKHLSDLEGRPEALHENVFDSLFQQAAVANLTKEEYDSYSWEIVDAWNNYAVMETKFNRGHEKGLQEGLEKGMKRGLEKGLEKGMKKGLEKGIMKGREIERQSIINMLREQGISEDILERI